MTTIPELQKCGERSHGSLNLEASKVRLCGRQVHLPSLLGMRSTTRRRPRLAAAEEVSSSKTRNVTPEIAMGLHFLSIGWRRGGSNRNPPIRIRQKILDTGWTKRASEVKIKRPLMVIICGSEAIGTLLRARAVDCTNLRFNR